MSAATPKITERRIRFNAFDMNCVGHQSPGLWRHPDDQSWRYKDLRYWADLAQTLEKGFFDGLFIADVLGTYDTFGGTPDAAIRQGAQVPVNDPFLLVSAMALVTENLGFGVTAGTAYEHPYPFARRLSTLDHLTNGRVGWNVVTGYLPSAARNMGNQDQLEHDERYDHADEYLEVVYKLLEGSWEDDAVVRDREAGVFADPAKVHGINHEGRFFKVPGIHLSEPSPQRTPVIFQAGASPRGVAFAAGNAEAIFVASPTKSILKDTVVKIRDAVEAEGRDRYSVRIYTLLTIITDATPEAAQAKHEDYQKYASHEGALVLLSGWMGTDLSQYNLDDPIGDVKSNAIQSVVANLQKKNDDGQPWTLRDIAERASIGGLGPRLVGSGSEVAEELISWVEDTDVDGFNLAYAITPGTFEDIVEFVIPELQKRNAYPDSYEPGTLRNKLFGAGDKLPQEHRGSRFRLSDAHVVS
ncbi:LLM class flavin-dependent oxidoreductase [Arthrobacter roseus]|uniref:LLM class flavin-dependent oxidoreductase n=1 Tax=Arthrobacter roseus TaxID=136274 RepID=UPI0030843152|nr:FMN-dependent oxidoreductase (nitrilotriacetate monooxygenase family) [Arthrobacter roseus]